MGHSTIVLGHYWDKIVIDIQFLYGIVYIGDIEIMRTFLLFINLFAVPLLLAACFGYAGFAWVMIGLFALISFGGQTTDKN